MIRSSALSHTAARAIVLFTVILAGVSWTDAAAPSLLPAATYDAGGGATQSVVVTDVNGDGRADLVVALQNNPGATHVFNGLVAVLLGNGDGTYAAATTYDSAGMQPFSLAVGDINGDSKPDIVVANFCNYVENTCSVTTFGLLLGHGDGTFAPAVPMQLGGNSASSVAIADLNNDGVMDIVATVLAATAAGPAVEVLIGNGDATFRAPMFVAAGDDDLRSVTVGHVNGDAAPDLVLTGNKAGGDGHSHGTVSILIGMGDGTFQPVVKYDSGASPGGWANAAALADFNSDGRLDVTIANYPDDRVGVLLGNGDGTLQPVVLYDSGARYAWSVAAADVNGDGKPDVSVGHASGVIGVLAGNADGTFGMPQPYLVPGVATSLAAADLNGDGKIDLVVSNGNRTVSVLLNGALCDAVAPVVTVSADPAVLWPPTGKTVAVTLSGTVGSACPLGGAGVTYAGSDEYGELAPSGPVAISADGSFSFVLRLPASRRAHDLDGRQYTIVVQAQTVSGGASTATATVRVAHDRRK
jgi:hypothetical protein